MTAQELRIALLESVKRQKDFPSSREKSEQYQAYTIVKR